MERIAKTAQYHNYVSLCNLFMVHYNTCQGYVRFAKKTKKQKTKHCLQWIKVVEKNNST